MPSVTSAAQEAAEKVRDLLLKMRTECRGLLLEGDPRHGPFPHDVRCCGGVLSILDPRFAALLAVLQVECRHRDLVWRDTGRTRRFCPDCGELDFQTASERGLPPGYVARIWTDLPQGALRGGIDRAVSLAEDIDLWIGYLEVFDHLGDDPDLAACNALITVLRKKMVA